MDQQKWIGLCKLTGLAYALTFACGAAIFLFFGPFLLEQLNNLSVALGRPGVNADAGLFWRILTVAMMTNITALSFMIWQNPTARAPLFVPLVVCKFTSAALGLAFFFARALPVQDAGSLVILVIFLTDFPLGAWALYLYWKRPRGDVSAARNCCDP